MKMKSDIKLKSKYNNHNLLFFRKIYIKNF